MPIDDRSDVDGRSTPMPINAEPYQESATFSEYLVLSRSRSARGSRPWCPHTIHTWLPGAGMSRRASDDAMSGAHRRAPSQRRADRSGRFASKPNGLMGRSQVRNRESLRSSPNREGALADQRDLPEATIHQRREDRVERDWRWGLSTTRTMPPPSYRMGEQGESLSVQTPATANMARTSPPRH